MVCQQKDNKKEASVVCASRKSNKKEQQLLLILPFMICGFGLTWAAVFVFAYGFVFSPSPMVGNPQSPLVTLCFLLGIVVGEALIGKKHLWLSCVTSKRKAATTAILCMAVMSCGIMLAQSMEIPSVVIMALAVLPGLWEGTFHVLWGEAFAVVVSDRSTRYMYASVVFGAAVFVVITFSAGGVSEVLITLLVAIFSYACLLIALNKVSSLASKTLRGDTFSNGSYDGSVRYRGYKDAPTNQRHCLLFVVYGVVFGFGLSSSILVGKTVWNCLTIGIALASGVAVLLVIEILAKRNIAFVDIARYLLPLLAIELVPIPFVDENLRWLLCLLLVMTITMFDTASFAFLASFANCHKQDPVYAIAWGRMFIQLGMLLGYAANTFLVDIVKPLSVYALYFPPVLVILLFFAVAFMGSFDTLANKPMCQPTYLTEVESGVTAASSSSASSSVAAVRSTVFEDISDISSANYTNKAKVPVKAQLKTNVDIISQHHGLSKREIDVLEQLIKGYSAPSIASKLVLSESTVKTHIYHIYQKLNINSRSELFAIAEELDRQIAL